MRGIACRAFVVGCPRSGTTLLQSLLAAHPGVTSFPESHFLRRLEPDKALYRRLGLASRRAVPRLEAYVSELREHGSDARAALGDWQAPGWPLKWSARVVFRAFVRSLDRVALVRGAGVWIEKTPNHLRYVHLIERYLPRARVIHIVRDGLETVASLYRVTHAHPESWDGAWGLERCVDRWNESISRTAAQAGKPNHCLVRYEKLVERPAEVLAPVCALLGIEFRDEMLGGSSREGAAGQVVNAWETWKAGAFEGVAQRGNAVGTAVDGVLSPAQQDYVRERLLEPDTVLGAWR